MRNNRNKKGLLWILAHSTGTVLAPSIARKTTAQGIETEIISTMYPSLSPEQAEIATTVARAVNGKVLGLDFLFDPDGQMFFLEANSYPNIYGEEQKLLRTRIADCLVKEVKGLTI